MIESQLVLDLLDLLLDQEQDALAFRAQIPHLSIGEIEYTGGAGAFIYFKSEPSIELFKQLSKYTNFNAVLLSAEELTADAEAIVHIKNGVMDYLEIWSHDGNYPNHEVQNYKAWQAWDNSPGRRLP
jgi:hypothetical protein